MSYQQCRNHLFEEQKTFLTPSEEDQLIRRLYTCPKVPFFPPRLYEDLPPLKFWNSTASVIESYLHRKVFQRRLQLAYEFNQSKEAGLHTTEGDLNESPDLLSQAMVQLTADINYFEHVASKQSLIQAEEMKLEAAQNVAANQNKAYWEYMFPEIITTTDIENGPITVEQPIAEPKKRGTFLDEIKKRYFNYQNFYRMQNLKEENKKALALTIGIPQSNTHNKTSETTLAPSVSFYGDEKQQYTNKNQQTRKIVLKTEPEHPMTVKSSHKQSVVSTGRLPKITYSSLYALKKSTDQNLHYLPKMSNERESLLPSLSPSSSLENNFSKRGTVVTLRDSLLLTQERLSKVSKIFVPKPVKKLTSQISLASHRDSYTVMMNRWLEKHKTGETVTALGSENNLENNNQKNETSKSSPYLREQRNTLEDHHDSFFLGLERLSSSKKKEISEELICDVCNNQYQQIHFTCSLHAQMSSPIVLKTPAHSINVTRNKTTSFLSHKDSVELARRNISFRAENPAVECQTENVEINNNTLPTVESKPPQSDVELTRSKINKQKHAYAKNEDMNSTSCKLNHYLNNSLQIHQIIISKNNLPLK